MCELLSLLLGAFISLITLWVKSYLDRETHVSKRIADNKLEAIDAAWGKWVEFLYALGPGGELGEEAEEAMIEFKKEVEGQQVFLDKKVADSFVGLYRDVGRFVDEKETDPGGNHKSWYSFSNQCLEPRMKEVREAVSESTDAAPHKVWLRVAPFL